MELKGPRLHLRPVLRSDLNQNYVDWLNDPFINQFLETRFHIHDHKSIYEYWDLISKDPLSSWFAIDIAGG